MFDPVEFFHLACKLREKSGALDSAAARTCINRAYYAAFLVAREKAKIRNENLTVHKEVIKYFQGKKPTVVGNNLSDLFELRKKADYNLSSQITERDSKKAIVWSKTILEAFGKELKVETTNS